MVQNYLNGSNSSVMFFDDEPHIFENIYIRAGLVLLYSSIFVLCFFGNLAVFLVVSLQWKRRSVSKFCLGNMAVANFSVSLFCILQNLTLYLLDTWIFGELMCKMYHFITNLCHAASILILVSISIERYMVLLHPFRCRQILTTRKLVLITLTVWLLSAGISLPRFFYFGLIRIQLNENGDFGDICVPIKSMYNSATADTIYFFLMYLAPLSVVSVMYLRIGLFLRQSERLRREIDDQTTGVHVTSSSGSPLQTGQRHLDDLNGLQDSSTGEVHLAPEELELASVKPDSPSSSVVFTFRGQILPQNARKNSRSSNLKRPWKCREYRTHVLRFVSTAKRATHSDDLVGGYSPEQRTGKLRNKARPRENVLIGEKEDNCKVRRCDGSGGFEGDTDGSRSTTTSLASSSILHRRSALVLNSETQRILYRYNRLQLSHIRSKQRQRVVRMLIFVVLTFAVLNLPYHVRKLCLNYSPSFDLASDANNLIAPLTFALMYANCAVNPILYAFMSKHFRASLRDFCCKCGFTRVQNAIEIL